MQEKEQAKGVSDAIDYLTREVIILLNVIDCLGERLEYVLVPEWSVDQPDKKEYEGPSECARLITEQRKKVTQANARIDGIIDRLNL